MTPDAVNSMQILFGAIGIFGGSMAAVWSISWHLHKLINVRVKERDEKFNTVFRRMDECKTEVDRKYQPREVCGILHKSLGEKVGRIEDDVTEVKRDVKILIGYANGKPK